MRTPVLPHVLVITDPSACSERGRGVVATVARMLDDVDAAWAAAVLVRDKKASRDEVAALCTALLPIARRARMQLLVHTHAMLVGPLRLDGVHLDSRTPARPARLRLPPGALLGVSRHVDDGVIAEAEADYATLSPIFASTSKSGDLRVPLGTAALRGHSTPVFALGGVDRDNVRQCLAAGARGVAVLGAVMAATDPRRALLEILSSTGVDPHHARA